MKTQKCKSRQNAEQRDLESIVDSNGILEEDSRVEEMKVLVSSLHTELKAIVEAIKIEDGVRELYTLIVPRMKKLCCLFLKDARMKIIPSGKSR